MGEKNVYGMQHVMCFEGLGFPFYLGIETLHLLMVVSFD